VTLDRESKQKRGLLRTNSQIQVANRAGDLLGSSATRTVNSAAKDACNLILADGHNTANWLPRRCTRKTATADGPAPAAPVSTPTAVAPATEETPQQAQARAQRNTVVISVPCPRIRTQPMPPNAPSNIRRA